MPPCFTYGLCSSFRASAFRCAAVAAGWPSKYTLTTSSFFTWFDHDTVHVPSAMKSPSRNMPISTVMVAATVVDRFAPSDRHASDTSSFALALIPAPAPAKPAPPLLWKLRRAYVSFSGVASAALVAHQAAVLELDHALAHLVDHLAIV